MKRRSRLGVLIRLARHEEARTLRAFGEQRRALDTITARLEAEQRALASSGRTAWLGTRRAATPFDLRAADRHTAHLAERAAGLALEQQDARRKLEEARQALCEVRLRVRALCDAEQRREAREARAHQKRAQRRLEEAHRGAGGDPPANGGAHAASD